MEDERDACDGGDLKLDAMVKWLCRQLELKDAGGPFKKGPRTADEWAVLAELAGQKEAEDALRRRAG